MEQRLKFRRNNQHHLRFPWYRYGYVASPINAKNTKNSRVKVLTGMVPNMWGYRFKILPRAWVWVSIFLNMQFAIGGHLLHPQLIRPAAIPIRFLELHACIKLHHNLCWISKKNLCWIFFIFLFLVLSAALTNTNYTNPDNVINGSKNENIRYQVSRSKKHPMGEPSNNFIVFWVATR